MGLKQPRTKEGDYLVQREDHPIGDAGSVREGSSDH